MKIWIYKHRNCRKNHSVEEHQLNRKKGEEVEGGMVVVGKRAKVEKFEDGEEGEEEHGEQDLWHYVQSCSTWSGVKCKV